MFGPGLSLIGLSLEVCIIGFSIFLFIIKDSSGFSIRSRVDEVENVKGLEGTK